MIAGIVVHSQDIKRPDIPVETLTLADFQRIKSWGLNTVQFMLEWDKMMNNGSYPNVGNVIDMDFITRLDRAITAASQAGLDIIFKIFFDKWACENGGRCLQSLWTNPVVQQDFITMWTFLVNRYKENPSIKAYHLLNEPRPTTEKHWGWTQAEEDAMYNAWNFGEFSDILIQAIRAIDPNRMIMFQPGKYGNAGTLGQSTMVPRPFPNMGYVFSWYDPASVTEECGEWAGIPADLAAGLQPAINFGVKYGVPIFCQEFGIRTRGCIPLATSRLAWVDESLKLFSLSNVGWFYYVYGHWQTLGFNVVDENGNDRSVVPIIVSNTSTLPNGGEKMIEYENTDAEAQTLHIGKDETIIKFVTRETYIIQPGERVVMELQSGERIVRPPQ